MRGEIRAAEMRLVGAAVQHRPRQRTARSTGRRWRSPTETLAIDRLQHRGRPRHAHRCGEQLAAGARQAVVHRRGALADRPDPRRGRVRHRRRALRLRDLGRPLRRRRHRASSSASKTAERPLTIEAEGMLAFDRGAPRFDGTLTLARPAGAVLASGKAVAHEPWRLDQQGQGRRRSRRAGAGRVPVRPGGARRRSSPARPSSSSASSPQLQGALSARQVDLDRLLATPDAPRRLPLAADAGVRRNARRRAAAAVAGAARGRASTR